MLITAMTALLALAAALRGLRHRLYALHLLLVGGAAYLIDPGMAWPAWHPQTVAWVIGLHLISINLVTVLAYGWDKRAARHGGWRVPERTLHQFMLVGGTPGAILGQKLFRHKTRKESFRVVFWLILALQLVGLAVLTTY